MIKSVYELQKRATSDTERNSSRHLDDVQLQDVVVLPYRNKGVYCITEIGRGGPRILLASITQQVIYFHTHNNRKFIIHFPVCVCIYVIRFIVQMSS